MYKAKANEVQHVMNYLQTRPYKETVMLAEALVKSKKENDYLLIEEEVVAVIKRYLYELPLGEVYNVVKLIDTFKVYEPHMDEPSIQEYIPPQFDENKSNSEN